MCIKCDAAWSWDMGSECRIYVMSSVHIKQQTTGVLGDKLGIETMEEVDPGMGRPGMRWWSRRQRQAIETFGEICSAWRNPAIQVGAIANGLCQCCITSSFKSTLQTLCLRRRVESSEIIAMADASIEYYSGGSEKNTGGSLNILGILLNETLWGGK